MKTSRHIALAITLCLLLSQLFVLIEPIVRAENTYFTLHSYNYKSSAGTQEIYPGSKRVEVTITLVYQGSEDAQVVAGCLELPEYFTPSAGSTACSSPRNLSGDVIVVVKPGDFIVFTFYVDVDGNATPGVYSLNLTIHYRIGLTSFSEKITDIELVVSEYPPLTLEVSTWYWSPAGYPGSEGVYLYVSLRNNGDSRIVDARGDAFLPEDVFSPSRLSFQFSGLGRNETVLVALGPLSIYPDAQPDTPYVIRLKVNATLSTGDGVVYYDEEELVLEVTIDKAPMVKLSVLDYGLETVKPVGGVKLTRFYILFSNMDFKTIRSITAYFTISSPGAVFTNGSQVSVSILQRSIGYGDVFTLYSGELEVYNASDVKITVTLIIFGDDNGAEFWSTMKLDFTVRVNTPGVKLQVVSTHWASGEVYPGTQNAVLIIELANDDIVDVRDAVVETYLPLGFIPQRLVSSNIYIQGGTITSITQSGIQVNKTIAPGIYPIHIVIKGYALDATTGSYYFFTAELTSHIEVSEYNGARPQLKLVSAYWGVQTPLRVIPRMRNVPLTITLLNAGAEQAQGIVVELKPLNDTVRAILSSTTCSTILPSGGVCSATFYVDLDAVREHGYIAFEVLVNYLYAVSNTIFEENTTYRFGLIVEEPAQEGGLSIVNTYWINNWPVYPETENATLRVMIANRWPYSISGIQLELLLPQGFNSKGENKALAYIPGPISSQQTFTVDFSVSIGNVKPGTYTITLRAVYTLESGAPATRVLEERSVKVVVNDPLNSIQVVSTSWLIKQPEPPEYGAILQVVVRNNLNPSMRGVVLELELPTGFLDADSNTSYSRSLGTGVNIAQQLSTYPTSGVGLTPQLIQTLLQQASVSGGSYGQGDMIYFYPRLNVLVDKPGVYEFKGYLSFIDHWGNERRIPVVFNVSILGSFKLIEIEAPESISVVNGTSTLTIKLVNKGSSPLYNVYLYLVPYVAMLIPQDAVKYIDVMPSNEPVVVNYTLLYNPMAITSGGFQAYLRYMTTPFSLGIMYRDASGHSGYYNTSLAVLIEPFIELSLSITKATESNNTLSISGVLYNYGIATARSIVVKAVYGDNSEDVLIGDLDPASQTVFRVEVETKGESRDSALLIVTYRDEYGRVNELQRVVNIEKTEVSPLTTPTPTREETTHWYILVAVAVTVFLALVAYMIYWYLKKHIHVQQTPVSV